MSWTDPITWKPGKVVNEDDMNAQVKANMDYLKLRTDDSGELRPGFYGWSHSAGQYNTGTGWNTMTSFDRYIPANYCANQGDGLLLEVNVIFGVAADARYAAVRLNDASGTLVTVASGTDSTSNQIARVILQRGSASTGGYAYGYTSIGTAAARTSQLVVQSLSSLNWAAQQLLRWYVYSTSSGAGSVGITSVRIWPLVRVY